MTLFQEKRSIEGDFTLIATNPETKLRVSNFEDGYLPVESAPDDGLRAAATGVLEALDYRTSASTASESIYFYDAERELEAATETLRSALAAARPDATPDARDGFDLTGDVVERLATKIRKADGVSKLMGSHYRSDANKALVAMFGHNPCPDCKGKQALRDTDVCSTCDGTNRVADTSGWRIAALDRGAQP